MRGEKKDLLAQIQLINIIYKTYYIYRLYTLNNKCCPNFLSICLIFGGALMPFLRIIVTLPPTSISGYVLLRFACKDIFSLTSNSCFFSLLLMGSF